MAPDKKSQHALRAEAPASLQGPSQLPVRLREIHCFADFLEDLELCGMTPGGENGEGVFTLSACFGAEIRWHTGDPETDPWEWRMRVLRERDDIAYAKLFFGKSGYVTGAWYPFLLATRRGGKSPEELLAGEPVAAKIYDLVCENQTLPLHILRLLGNFGRADKSKFERALVYLQTKLLLTMCGSEQKRSRLGEEYGWSSTVFCPVERAFEEEIFQRAGALSPGEAAAAMEAHLLRLNPEADKRRMKKWIFG